MKVMNPDTATTETSERGGRTPTKNGGGQVQSLTRALKLLQRLSAADMGMNLTELAGGLGLAPSTAHRLLNSMRQLEFVDFDEQQQLWSVGVSAFAVGNAYLKKRDFVAQARPFMKQLVAETGETSNLAILEGDSHVFVGQVECAEVMRMVVQIGSRGAVHAAGVGKALLSSLPEEQAMAIIGRTGLPALTEKTITSADTLAIQLAQIRRQGFALDDEEQSAGLRCLAANIYDEHGDAVAAISISGPTARITPERIPECSAAVSSAADRITHAIGGCKPPV